MNETYMHRVIIALLLLLVILTGVNMFVVNAQFSSIGNILRSQAPVGSGLEPVKVVQESVINAGGEAKVLMRLETGLGLGRLSFSHACIGQVVYKNPGADMDGEYPMAYCKGENVLSVTHNNELPVELLRVTSSDVENAPLLQKVQPAGHAQEFDYVLISFGPNACALNDDFCGAGMPENYVTYLMNDELKIVKALKNYPMYGSAVLGNMRAAFITARCGGAGCDAAPIVGYNLLSDTVKNLTTESAGGELNAKDVRGIKLPVWKSLRYVSSQDKFEAVYLGVDGAEKKILIDGNF